MNKYAKYDPQLDKLFQDALRQGHAALNKLYNSAAWSDFLDRYDMVVINNLTLENLTLRDLTLQNIILDTAVWRDVQAINCIFHDVDASRAIFKNVTFDHCAIKEPGSFGSTFDLRHSTWTNVTFNHVDLRYWILGGGTFQAVQTNHAILPITQIELVELLKTGQFDTFNNRRYESTPEPHQLDLRGVDLSNIDLRGSYFDNIDARLANFEYANLSGENLFQNDFSGANLQHANLSHCHSTSYFYDTDLRGANLDGFIAKQPDWATTHLFGAKLDPDAPTKIIGLTPEAFAKPKYNYKISPPDIPAWNGFG